MNKEKRFNVEEHPTLDGRIIDVFPVSHRYIHELERQCKKQKEVINRAIEYIEKLLKEEIEITDENNIYYGEKLMRSAFNDDEVEKIKDILKEVSE